jgi:hypothetical protein
MGTHANLVSTYLAALGRGRTQGLAHSRHPTVPPSPPPTMRPKGATSALERGPPAHTHTTAMCNSRMVTDMLNRAGVQRRRGVRGMHAAREGATWSLPFGGLPGFALPFSSWLEHVRSSVDCIRRTQTDTEVERYGPTGPTSHAHNYSNHNNTTKRNAAPMYVRHTRLVRSLLSVVPAPHPPPGTTAHCRT